MAYKNNCTLFLHGQEDIYYYLVRNTNLEIECETNLF